MNAPSSRGPNVAAFDSMLESLSTYRPPYLPGVVREISSALSTQANAGHNTLRFFLPGFRRVVDITRPATLSHDSEILIEVGQVPPGQTQFPVDELEPVLDSKVFLSHEGTIRRAVARTALYGERDERLLREARLGGILGLAPGEQGSQTRQWQDVDPVIAARVLPALPDRLIEIATSLE